MNAYYNKNQHLRFTFLRYNACIAYFPCQFMLNSIQQHLYTNQTHGSSLPKGAAPAAVDPW